jgi:hypothetical protein
MRFILLAFVLFNQLGHLQAQTLTGKWNGYFSPSNDPENRIFTYEMDITELPNEQLNINTYTKQSNKFSAKAIASGLFTKNSKLVSITESRFEDLKMIQDLQACLMTNYLSYKNIRGHEIIEGTYTSHNPITKKDCGGGQVYLEKDIAIVKFINSKPSTTTIPNTDLKNSSAITTKTIPTATTKVPNLIIAKSASISNTTKAKELAKQVNTPSQTIQINNATPNKEEIAIETVPEEVTIHNTNETDSIISIKKGNIFQTIPWVLVGRENKLVKKINTTSNKLSIDLYDNGTIDNDTIIVYDNKQLLVNKKRLSYKAIHIDLNFSNTITEHEIIIVAHNMGSVPPNTALLVLKDEFTRQEYYITSTNKMNAKLLIQYTPPSLNN